MANVIHTVRMGASVVTLGKDEGSLHLSPDEVGEAPDRLDLAGLIRSRIEGIQKDLVTQWEQTVKDEHDTMRVASERQLQEAEERHRAEVERIKKEPTKRRSRQGLSRRKMRRERP